VAQSIPGADIIEPIERAVKDDRVTGLASVLAELNSTGSFEDGGFFSPPLGDHYARRLLWRDPAGHFLIVAMTWAPGQATPLHDHDGLWGAEIVVSGVMHETSYRKLEQNDRQTRFVHEGDTLLGERSVGILVPPLEYHAYRNAGRSVSHTVHVYAGLLENCTAFTRTQSDDDWWTGERHALRYDA
jgi:predicted metal-dependent enzyme (double-stranded beta helix superfamily)